MSTQKTTGTLSSHNGAMIEVAKITALVEVELQSQRKKHKDQLNRTIAKYKDRQEDSQREIDLLREERDNARRELENCKRNHGSQKRAAERNDRLQTQQKNRIEMLEEQKELFDQLQEERDALLDEVARSQQQQQKAKDELSVLKLRVRQDSQKRLSVMECLSTSWDAEKKEAQQKEALLNSELAIMSKTLKAEQQFLKNKNKEFAMLEAQSRVTKTELRSIKVTMVAKKEEMELELRRERESRTRLAEEHKEMLKLKDDEIYMAESTIRTMKAELKSTRECFSLKEKSMEQSIAATNISEEESEVANPQVKMLREENSRLNDEIKELQKQLESYLANMALQQEFCDSLKSRIYDKQETEQEQIDEIHDLRRCIKNQEKDAAEKDLQIEELKQLLESNSAVKVEAKSSRDLKRGKKSSMKKSKSSSRKSGYRTS
jgi:chromosome segregation ATPase